MQLDQGIFCWYSAENKLIGLMVCFVDDILYTGNENFATVVDDLKEKFVVGSENERKFHYIGINIKQYPNSIVISKNDYVDNLQPIPLSTIDTSDQTKPLVEVERTLPRGALGQLNWLSGITRLEISFSVCEISSRINQGIFCWYSAENKLIGLMVCFVDDILYAGNENFATVVDDLKEKFVVGSENERKFHYIGINIKQYPNSIVISKNDYVDNLQPIPLSTIDTSDQIKPLVEVEKTLLRGALGQLYWLSDITRPEISFSVSGISSRITTVTVADILPVNKTIKFVKNSSAYITIRKLDLSSLKIAAFSDSSYNNLPKGNSQGAYVVIVANLENSKCVR